MGVVLGAIILIGGFFFLLLLPFLAIGKSVHEKYVEDQCDKGISTPQARTAPERNAIINATPPPKFRCAQERRDYYRKVQNAFDEKSFFDAIYSPRYPGLGNCTITYGRHNVYPSDLERMANKSMFRALSANNYRWYNWVEDDPFIKNTYYWYLAIWSYIYSFEREYIGYPYEPRQVALTDKERAYIELCVPERLRRLPRDIRLERFPQLAEKMRWAKPEGKDWDNGLARKMEKGLPVVLFPILNPHPKDLDVYWSEEFIAEYERLYRESSRKMDDLWARYDDDDLKDMCDRIEAGMEINPDYFPAKENPFHRPYDENEIPRLYSTDIRCGFSHNSSKMERLIGGTFPMGGMTEDERNEIAEYMILGRTNGGESNQYANTILADDIWFPQIASFSYEPSLERFVLYQKSSAASLSNEEDVCYSGFEKLLDARVFNWVWDKTGPITLMEKTLAKIETPGKGCVYHVYELPRLAGFKTDL